MNPPTRSPELVADPAELTVQVDRVAAEVAADHADGVVLVGVLKGSVIFLADLARALRVPVRVELVAVAAYDGSLARTRVVKDLDAPVTDEAVVLVTGIVDTGLTADFLTRHLLAVGAGSVAVATLADKQARRLLPLAPTYAALRAPDRFLLGYGLDYRGRYRNLAGLWGVDAEELIERPDRYVDQLYGPVPDPSEAASRPRSTGKLRSWPRWNW